MAWPGNGILLVICTTEFSTCLKMVLGVWPKEKGSSVPVEFVVCAMVDCRIEKENNDEENFIVSKDDESETLLEFSFLVKKLDPDIILTKGGDQFLFPQLLYRSKINKIDENYYQI